MSEQQQVIRLNIWISNTTPRAVLLFRYRKKTLNRLVLWNLTDNTFIKGQWLTNAKIFPDRSMISPDGEYFAYFYGKYSKGYSGESYTIISKPPFFTANIAVYSETGTWTGGAIYRNYKGQKQLLISSKDHLFKGTHEKFLYDGTTILPTYIDCKETPRFIINGVSYEYKHGVIYNSSSSSLILDVSEDIFEDIKPDYELL